MDRKTLVYSTPSLRRRSRQLGLSVQGAAKRLGVSRTTVDKMVGFGALVPSIYETVGNRRTIIFDEGYIDLIKKVLPKDWDRGETKLTEDVVNKCKKIGSDYFSKK